MTGVLHRCSPGAPFVVVLRVGQADFLFVFSLHEVASLASFALGQIMVSTLPVGPQRTLGALADAIHSQVTERLRHLFCDPRLPRRELQAVAEAMTMGQDFVDTDAWEQQLTVASELYLVRSAGASRVTHLVLAMKDVLLERESGHILDTLAALGIRSPDDRPCDGMTAQLRALTEAAAAGPRGDIDDCVTIGSAGHLDDALRSLRALTPGQLGLLCKGSKYAPVMSWLREESMFEVDFSNHIDMMTAKQQV